ncbi:MAG TPA: GAF domain-containing protein, partial [Candidatus Saccharimonadales bacterium]|nr:GAF domain-containing protein [Candidatus Saccharimonadales bacterium]
MKIVIADDDPINRKYLRALLTHEGHTTIECEDGAATLAYLEQNPCDAVISDILMPRMDGFRLCYEIRKNKTLNNTPVILYTATYLSAADEKAALAMGADRFLRKPAVPEVIVDTLQEVIKNAQRHRNNGPKQPENSLALREYSEVLVRKLEQTDVALTSANEALRESEERQRFAASAGQIGIWEWDTATDRLVWSAEQKAIFGWPADRESITLQDLIAAILPDDRGLVHEALKTAVADHVDYQAEYRVVWPDGSMHWVSGKGHGDYDEAGHCTRMIGISLDITRRKEAEAAQQRSLERLRALHEIGLTINSSLNLATILDALLTKIEPFLPFSAATTVRLVNKKTGQMDPLACRNLDTAVWKSHFATAPAGRARQVLENRTLLIVRNVLADPKTRDPAVYRRLGVVSSVAVPLIVEAEALGILNLYTRQEHEFTDEEIEFLLTLSDQAAIAIHNARLYQDNERRRHEAEELARIGRSLTETLDMKAIGERVVNNVLALFGVQGATLRLRQLDGSMIGFATVGTAFSQLSNGAVLPREIGLASRAFAVGKPVWSADILNDANTLVSKELREYIRDSGNGSIITVPLRAHENLIGTISL